MPEPIIKRCKCCHREFTLAAWRTLQLVGFMEDHVERLELRNCDCRGRKLASTLALKVDQNGEPVAGESL